MTKVLLKVYVQYQYLPEQRNQESDFIDTLILNHHLSTSVIVIQSTMKLYVKGQQYIINILLSQIKCSKPIDQFRCCDVCNDVDCYVWDLICEGYDSSITELGSNTDSVSSYIFIPVGT